MGIRFSFMAIENSKAWLVPTGISGIVEVDLCTCKSKLLTGFDEYKIFDTLKLGTLQKKDNYIAAAPLHGEFIYLFNTTMNQLEKFSIADYEKNKNPKKDEIKFWSSFCRDKYIYFVGEGYPGIIKINTEEEQIKIIDINIENRNQLENTCGILGRSASIIAGNVYIPLQNSKEFVVFNLEREEYEIQKIGNHCCVAACCDRQNLCLMPMKNGVIEIFDTDKQTVRKPVKFPRDFTGEREERWYCTALCHCGYIWILPWKSNMILRLNLQTEEMICVKDFDETDNIKYLNAGIYDKNKIWAFYQSENRLDIIDCRSLQIESKCFPLPYNLGDFISREEILECCRHQGMKEEYLDVRDYISFICQEKGPSLNCKETEYTGIKIWNKIKNA